MALPEKRDHRISLEKATDFSENFKAANQEFSLKGGFFWADQIKEMLNQSDCLGMRYYYASDENGTPTIVLKGVDSSGKDMNSMILEKSFPCPPYCD